MMVAMVIVVMGVMVVIRKVWMEASEEDYQIAVIPWSHPEAGAWSLCRLWANSCWWGGFGLATCARSHWKSSHCRLVGQYEAYKQPPRCISVILRMECTGLTIVSGFKLWVGLYLALWRVDGRVIIWSYLVRLWVSLWCFVYFIITFFIFILEGLCWEFTMLGLIIETFVFGKGIVAATVLWIWLSFNWQFGTFTQQELAWMITEMRMLFGGLWECFSSKERYQQPCSILATCHS